RGSNVVLLGMSLNCPHPLYFRGRILFMNEFWEPLEDYPGYEISDQGRVRNTKTGRILKVADNGSNCMIVNLQRFGRSHVCQIRWLVARICLDVPYDLDSIPQHKNGDYRDCRAE